MDRQDFISYEQYLQTGIKASSRNQSTPTKLHNNYQQSCK